MRNREKRKYTVQDINELAEAKRVELIDGEMFMMETPNRDHQRISGKLFRIISDYIDREGGNAEVYFAPFSVYPFDDEYNCVEPDLTVVCDPEKLDERGCHGAPDWVIEVVSSGSQRLDYVRKCFEYEQAGVREYWIVDIDKQTVRCYDFEEFYTREYTFNDTIRVHITDDFRIDFTQVAGSVPLSSVQTYAPRQTAAADYQAVEHEDHTQEDSDPYETVSEPAGEEINDSENKETEVNEDNRFRY